MAESGASEQGGVGQSATRSTRRRVAELLASGYTITEIAHRLTVSKPTVCHHARRLGYAPSAKFNKRYDWAEVQRYYDGDTRFASVASTSASPTRRGTTRSGVVRWSREIGRRRWRSFSWPDESAGVATTSSVACCGQASRTAAASNATGLSGEADRSHWRFTTSTVIRTTTASRISACSAPTATARPTASPGGIGDAPLPDAVWPRSPERSSAPSPTAPLKPSPTPADKGRTRPLRRIRAGALAIVTKQRLRGRERACAPLRTTWGQR